MLRSVSFVGWLLLFNCLGFAQGTARWACADQVDGGSTPVRASAGVTATLAQKRILPDISDLKGSKIDSVVVVRILIDRSGDVKCAEAVQGDSVLFQRSEAAAMQWHFKPYLQNGQPVETQARITVNFTISTY